MYLSRTRFGCPQVLSTLTTDTGRIMAKLHLVRPEGNISFSAAIRVAHLALKHRQGKNHKTRIVAFVGSPVEENDKVVSGGGGGWWWWWR